MATHNGSVLDGVYFDEVTCEGAPKTPLPKYDWKQSACRFDVFDKEHLDKLRDAFYFKGLNPGAAIFDEATYVPNHVYDNLAKQYVVAARGYGKTKVMGELNNLKKQFGHDMKANYDDFHFGRISNNEYQNRYIKLKREFHEAERALYRSEKTLVPTLHQTKVGECLPNRKGTHMYGESAQYNGPRSTRDIRARISSVKSLFQSHGLSGVVTSITIPKEDHDKLITIRNFEFEQKFGKDFSKQSKALPLELDGVKILVAPQSKTKKK